MINYQLKLDNIIDTNIKEGRVPTLLLHACCAPCSSYVLEYLSKYFLITILYYNPNIGDYNEYKKRLDEEKKLISEMKLINPISIIEGVYDNDRFNTLIIGHEEDKEGANRCYICYRMRLEECACIAKEKNFDYFTTTLSVSPYKNSKWLNEIGESLQGEYAVNYLYADFKKKNGYKRSIELSHIYNLYRQDYCGCVYSIKRDDTDMKVSE